MLFKRSKLGRTGSKVGTQWFGAAATIVLLTCSVIPGRAHTTAGLIVETTGAMSGKVTDTRNLPIVGAVITARGPSVGWTATTHDGSFHLSIAAGSYDVLIRKGGYTPTATSVTLSAGAMKTVAVVLGEANLSSVNTGSVTSSANVLFSTGVSATASLSNEAMSERPALNVRELALELPGVTLAHPAYDVPDTSFVVRGGTNETRVQIDGHAVSAGATGRWNASLASLPLFDSIELVKGAGVSGANAGESAFGTVNLRTRDFKPGRQADVVLGTDNFGGSYSTFALSGNAASDRLSYIFEHNVSGYNGPQRGQIVYNVVEEPHGTALLADRSALTSPLMLGSDLAKLRWRFTGNTSLTVGYIGMHSHYFQTGGAYGASAGQRLILPSAPGAGLTQLSSPQYPALVGTTVPAYSFAEDTSVQTNQPLFEAELRTAIGNDTLLIRPYVATIYNVLDGGGHSAAVSANASTASNGALVLGTGCSYQAACAVASLAIPNRREEVDRLHGTTASLVHPLGDGTLDLSYDYHSDETAVSNGNPEVHFDGNLRTINAYLPIIPTTLARNFDWSATYSVPVTRRLRFYAGDYYTDWKLNYGSLINTLNFAALTANQTLVNATRTYRHDDPHFGLTWRPQSDTTFRLTAGSAITVPYAELVAGGSSYTAPFSGVGTLLERNENLQPESTVAYDLGLDHRFRNNTVIAADAFDNTIHNVFANRVTPFDGAATLGIPAGSPINAVFATTNQPVNAPLERNYGIELSLAHVPTAGLGYRFATTFQRAYLDQLPASFFGAANSFVNGKQLDGSTSIPYTHAYAQINLRNRSGVAAALSADYTGANNWTNGPAFSVWSSMLRYDFHNGYRAQFSIENMFDRNTGTQLASGVDNGGFAVVNYGAHGTGTPPIFGATGTTRFAISPRTFRFQVEAHVGH